MKKFITDISKNQNLEKNLPLYANYMMDLYGRRASVELAMDYYTFYGMLLDQIRPDETLQSLTRQFNAVLRDYVVDVATDEKREEGIKLIDTLRNNVYNIVEILTAYSDIFARYEHVVNRCEYLFREPEIDPKYTDEDFTRQIMQYLFADDDNAVINTKITEIVGELPLRMTKNKFFEFLCEGMSVYQKSDTAAIDDFIYDIRTSALLSLPEGIHEEKYQDLYEIYEKISQIDFAKMDEETFHQSVERLNYAADFIEKETNLYMMLAGLINKAYAMIITGVYADLENRDTRNARDIIEKINRSFDGEKDLTLEEDVTDRFVFMEGIPEEIQNVIQSVEYTLDHVRMNAMEAVENMMLSPVYHGLFLCEKLLADSLFINLHEDQIPVSENEKKDVEAYLVEKREALMKELRGFFDKHQKAVNRSVMSMILSRLPVFFNNVSEIQDYIYNSFSNCTNKAEKAACIEIVKSIMEE